MTFSDKLQYYGEQFQETKEEKYFNMFYELTFDYYRAIGYKYYHQQYHNLQDILNSFYLNVFQKINNYNPEKGKFHSWVGRIFTNEVYGNFYKRHKLVYFPDFWEEQLFIYNFDEEYDEELFIEQSSKLNNAISKLHEPHQTVIIEKYFKGLMMKEIAEKYGVNIQIVKNQLRSAREKLKYFVEDPWYKYPRKIQKNENILYKKIKEYNGGKFS